MANLIGSITRAATRRPGEALNVCCMPTHERWESCLAKTGHNFYAIRCPQVKDWNKTYAPVPDNYILLNPNRGPAQLPPEVDFDVVLSQNKAGQFGIAREVARQLHLPMISLEHTLPHPQWGKAQLELLRSCSGDINVFISEYSVKEWGWKEEDATVIHHGVDTDTFKSGNGERKAHALSVVNDWINRNWCCGFELWRDATRGLPTVVVGATPGLSEAAKSVPDLVSHYQQAQVFVNTSLISPIPTALLEAMSCGCACVSTNNCMIPEIIEHGANGLLGKTPDEIRQHTKFFLEHPEVAAQMGEAARRTILEKFSLNKFVANWNAVLERAANIVFKG